MADTTTSTGGSLLDTIFNTGLSVATQKLTGSAIKAPANTAVAPAPAQKNWKPWAIGGAAVVVVLIIVTMLFRRRG